MHFIIYVLKRILLLPIDLLAMLFGGIPLSYYVHDQHVSDCNSRRFERNEAECQKKYGMTMLEKIQLEEKNVLGDEEFKKIEAKRIEYMDPWYGLDILHDVMCTTEGMFDFFLEEYINLLKLENEAGTR